MKRGANWHHARSVSGRSARLIRNIDLLGAQLKGQVVTPKRMAVINALVVLRALLECHGDEL